MTMLADRQGEREATLLHTYREELVERIGRAITADGSIQPLPGLHLYRHSMPLERVYSVVDPSVCVVAQGSKEFLLGESRYRYDPFHYLLSTVDLPSIGQVLEASKERPFLSLRLSLDPGMVSSVMLEAGYRKPSGKAPGIHPGDEPPLLLRRIGWGWNLRSRRRCAILLWYEETAGPPTSNTDTQEDAHLPAGTAPHGR